MLPSLKNFGVRLSGPLLLLLLPRDHPSFEQCSRGPPSYCTISFNSDVMHHRPLQIGRNITGVLCHTAFVRKHWWAPSMLNKESKGLLWRWAGGGMTLSPSLPCLSRSICMVRMKRSRPLWTVALLPNLTIQICASAPRSYMRFITSET